MSKTKAGPIAADRLKSFIERIERLIEERVAIQSDIKDVFSEAKGVGYDVKTMRSLIKLRTIDVADRDEQAALLDTYAHALGMVVSDGPAVVEVLPNEDVLMERAARIVREVEACMDILEGGKPPKIEAIKALVGCSTGKAHKLRTLIAERLSRSNRSTMKNENENPETAGPHTTPPGDGSERAESRAASGAAVANSLLALEEPATASDVAPPCPPGEGSEIAGGSETDDLTIPTFLRRTQEVRA